MPAGGIEGADAAPVRRVACDAVVVETGAIGLADTMAVAGRFCSESFAIPRGALTAFSATPLFPFSPSPPGSVSGLTLLRKRYWNSSVIWGSASARATRQL